MCGGYAVSFQISGSGLRFVGNGVVVMGVSALDVREWMEGRRFVSGCGRGKMGLSEELRNCCEERWWVIIDIEPQASTANGYQWTEPRGADNDGGMIRVCIMNS